MGYEPGSKVSVNGNNEGVVLSYDSELGMYNVRLWDGTRHVGDITVSGDRLQYAQHYSTGKTMKDNYEILQNQTRYGTALPQLY